MRVDFRRADVLMAQQCLDDAEVGTAFEQGSGKRVPEGMGRDGLLDACRLGLPLDHDEDHRARQVCARRFRKT